jgi:hypothetical protein
MDKRRQVLPKRVRFWSLYARDTDGVEKDACSIHFIHFPFNLCTAASKRSGKKGEFIVAGQLNRA